MPFKLFANYSITTLLYLNQAQFVPHVARMITYWIYAQSNVYIWQNKIILIENKTFCRFNRLICPNKDLKQLAFRIGESHYAAGKKSKIMYNSYTCPISAILKKEVYHKFNKSKSIEETLTTPGQLHQNFK